MADEVTQLELRVGMAAVDITPDHPVPLAGYAGRVQPHTGVHDPIYCRAMAMEDTDGRRVVLFSIGVLNFMPEQDRVYRAKVAEALGLAPHEVMLHCYHPHSSPLPWNVGKVARADEAYLDFLVEKIVEVGRGALENLALRRFAWGIARNADWLYNRHQELKDGSYSLQFVERSDLASWGPIDDRLRVVVLENDAGEADGAVVFYTAHPVVMGGQNRLITGEYPEALLRHLGEKTGIARERMMFLNGACGDTNPMHTPGRSFDLMDDMGRDLADTAVRAIEHRVPLTGEGVSAMRAEFEVRCDAEPEERRAARREQAEGALEQLAKADPAALAQDDATGEEVIATRRAVAEGTLAWLDRHEQNDFPESETLDLTVWKVGELKLVAAPFELMLQSALDAEERLVPPVLVLYATNGCPGYLGDDSVHDHSRSYEIGQSYVYYGRPGPFERGTAGRLVDAWEEMVGL